MISPRLTHKGGASSCIGTDGCRCKTSMTGSSLTLFRFKPLTPLIKHPRVDDNRVHHVHIKTISPTGLFRRVTIAAIKLAEKNASLVINPRAERTRSRSLHSKKKPTALEKRHRSWKNLLKQATVCQFEIDSRRICLSLLAYRMSAFVGTRVGSVTCGSSTRR